MKKLSITLVLLASLSAGAAYADNGGKPRPPQSGGFVAQTEQGPVISIFKYFRNFSG